MSIWVIICFTMTWAYALLILIYYVGWLMIPKPKLSSIQLPKQGFSILVPARNEAQHIEACMHAIIAQDYPTSMFELIVMNDHSTDCTAEIVQTIATQYPQISIRLIHAEERGVSGKKACITAAISEAAFNYICLTDADCTRGVNWLNAINESIQTRRAQLIYAPVFFSSNNLFEQSQALEFMGLLGIGAAAIQLKNPNMCSAANLIFNKEVFLKIGGYSGNENLASGDDEFLLHKVFKLYPNEVYFLKDDRAIVETSPNSSLHELTQQRRRWVSKSTKYENRYITAILVGAYLFNFSIFLNFFAAIYMPFLWKIFMIQILVKMVAEGLLIYAVLRFFKKGKSIFLLPIVEPFHVLYVLIIGIWANVQNFTWKERSLK